MLNMLTVYAGFASEAKLMPFDDVFRRGIVGQKSEGFWSRSSQIALKASTLYVINNSDADHDSLRENLSSSQWCQPEATEHRGLSLIHI